MALANLDAVLIEARSALEALPPHLLDELEGAVKAHLARGGDAVVAVPPGSPTRAALRQSSGSPLGIGRPTAAPLDLGELCRPCVACGLPATLCSALLHRPGGCFADWFMLGMFSAIGTSGACRLCL